MSTEFKTPTGFPSLAWIKLIMILETTQANHHRRPMAPTGTIATALPNPSAKTSSRGLRQHCLRLVWVDSCGGVSISIVLSLVRICPFFILVLCRCHTPFAPPVSMIDGRPHLAIFPLPCHFFGNTIDALPLPWLVWSGTIDPLPLPCRHHCHICTTAAIIGLSPCHHCQHMSLTSDASPLVFLAGADANVVVASPWLWWC